MTKSLEQIASELKSVYKYDPYSGNFYLKLSWEPKGEGEKQMTKSIEEQAQEYADEKRREEVNDLDYGYASTLRKGFIAGAKARDAQWSAVVNELLVKLNTCKNDYWFMTNLLERYASDQGQAIDDCVKRMKFRTPMFDTSKADQMLKEMGISL